MSDHKRLRDKTICFRATEEEWRDIEARVAVSGLQKGDYFIQSLLHQQIHIVAGKFQSNRLSFEVRMLSAALAKAVELDGPAEVVLAVNRCQALLAQVKQYMEACGTDEDDFFERPKRRD